MSYKPSQTSINFMKASDSAGVPIRFTFMYTERVDLYVKDVIPPILSSGAIEVETYSPGQFRQALPTSESEVHELLLSNSNFPDQSGIKRKAEPDSIVDTGKSPASHKKVSFHEHVKEDQDDEEPSLHGPPPQYSAVAGTTGSRTAASARQGGPAAQDVEMGNAAEIGEHVRLNAQVRTLISSGPHRVRNTGPVNPAINAALRQVLHEELESRCPTQ
ncbi:hypothetical protein EJ03DRAFT_331585 [Teratosphaeria nubilosa]|uniref:Uncharacterized protein n=1 Tax=Teratosphaeria nubilosa TaxID=161662 RepID=A0A6G1KXH2_9PEZI|nr:hypothetical protein EJ03DRAFT_331585 [Teratosphaeria nubilosa]